MEERSSDSKVPAVRGDGFDIPGESGDVEVVDSDGRHLPGRPFELRDALNQSESQARNTKTAITSIVTAGSVHWLGRIFGSTIAGGIGGTLGGFFADKLVGKRRR